ncbi:MAG: hypothetical protein L0Y71_10295 [Gemmataceae bacterium]|nr:hypothetical protein [Gemmataceae bacterium]
MSQTYKQLAQYLGDLGIDQVEHTQKNYLGHLLAVYRLMKDAGCEEEVCQAGMFHSIYGTQKFQGFKLPLESRAEIRGMIGERAERLAYLNCAMQRETFDEALGQSGDSYTFRDRITGDQVTLNRQDFDDLCRVHLYDWLEQVPRSRYGWGYRREAYRQMTARLGPDADETYRKVFANEPAPAASPVGS